jgi:hypothetical protein
MRYDQPTSRNGYRHSIFYGKNACADFEKGMIEFSRQSEDPAFWTKLLRAIKFNVTKRFQGHRDARGIILHHESDGSPIFGHQAWDTVYVASPEFDQNLLNCECFGHMGYPIGSTRKFCHIPGDWMKEDSFYHKFRNYEYLESIDPMGRLPRPPSPGLQTTFGKGMNWYDPSNPLTSFRKKILA